MWLEGLLLLLKDLLVPNSMRLVGLLLRQTCLLELDLMLPVDLLRRRKDRRVLDSILLVADRQAERCCDSIVLLQKYRLVLKPQLIVRSPMQVRQRDLLGLRRRRVESKLCVRSEPKIVGEGGRAVVRR
jgi:hypothetical protein